MNWSNSKYWKKFVMKAAATAAISSQINKVSLGLVRYYTQTESKKTDPTL